MINWRRPRPRPAKIIYVRGSIDANTDASGRKLSCTDYARNGYTLQQYLATDDPAVWGREREPPGAVEEARRASQLAQAAQITIPIGSNTTIIGLRGASITGAALRINGEQNVIIRGLTITDAYDCFPSWDPTDGATGNWNSEYDIVSLTGATNVWVDHNEFSDGRNLDADQPSYFGRPTRSTTVRWTSPTPPTWSPSRTTGSAITTRPC